MIRVDLEHCVCQQVLNTNTKRDLIGSHLLVSASWTQFLLVGNSYLVPSLATTSYQPPASISQHNKETQTWRPPHHHGRERMMRQEDNLLMIIIDNFSPSFSLPAVSDQRRV